MLCDQVWDGAVWQEHREVPGSRVVGGHTLAPGDDVARFEHIHPGAHAIVGEVRQIVVVAERGYGPQRAADRQED